MRGQDEGCTCDTQPVGVWRSLTADSVLLRCCPPGPEALYVSTLHCLSSSASVRDR